jgi:hypothetical protein
MGHWLQALLIKRRGLELATEVMQSWDLVKVETLIRESLWGVSDEKLLVTIAIRWC